MMNPRIAPLVSLAILLAFSPKNPARADVDTRAIDAVRAKTVLDAGDLQAIDDFVSAAVKEVSRTRDFSQVAKARAVLIGKKGAQPQYAKQFSDCCRKHIAASLEQAAANLPEDRKFKVTLNLLILADGLQDVAMADLGLAYLNSPNKALRYWAVRLVTNTTVVDRINQGNWPVGGQILSQLQQLIRVPGRPGPSETLGLVAEFAAKVNAPEGQQLLMDAADLRITEYASGQAEDGQADTTLLKLLSTRLAAANANAKTAQVASRFAQLYSYVIQRLAKAGSALSEAQKEQLISVVVEVEEKCIAPLAESYLMPLRKAIEKSDMAALLTEHDRLLGSSTVAGQWVTKWQFDYGTGPDGKARTWPKDLSRNN